MSGQFHFPHASCRRYMSLSDRIKVVLVEVDHDQRTQRAAILEGFEEIQLLQSIATEQEALSRIPELQPDIILLDMRLPGTSVADCARALKSQMPQLNILLLMGPEDRSNVFNALRAGATGYISKRLEPIFLPDRLFGYHTGETILAGSLATDTIELFQNPLPSADPEVLLTQDEMEILRKAAEGYRIMELAAYLQLNQRTLKKRMRRICEKLHAYSKAEAQWKGSQESVNQS